ncbi:MAG: PilZ domain-containing protein [Desulfamplus sp.]|nr:PilZ domain-containing protein [Desulfamplus sp.]
MPIENLLTKIIVNTNKLPHEKQKQLLQITQDWLAQVASGKQDSPSSKDVSSISTVIDPPLTSPHKNLDYETDNAAFEFKPVVSNKSDSAEPPQIFSTEPLPITPSKEDLVVNIIEERAYERKNVSIPIEFVSSGQLHKEITKDLSAGGLFIKTKKHNKFKKNQKISMVFVISEDRKPFKLTGKVIRVESEGIAVQFHNVSPFECVAIEEELSSNSC